MRGETHRQRFQREMLRSKTPCLPSQDKPMKKIKLLLTVMVVLISAGTALAQKQELAGTIGALKPSDKTFDLPTLGTLKFDTGFTYQINYARRFFNARLAALYVEFPFVGTPTTNINSSNALSPRSYSTIFFTPGVRLKVVPGFKYSPYAVVGGGLGRFSESSATINGLPNPNSGSHVEGVFDFGGGLDVRLVPFVSLRGEIRDFYSGVPPLNVSGLKGREHNALFSGGVVLRF